MGSLFPPSCPPTIPLDTKASYFLRNFLNHSIDRLCLLILVAMNKQTHVPLSIRSYGLPQSVRLINWFLITIDHIVEWNLLYKSRIQSPKTQERSPLPSEIISLATDYVRKTTIATKLIKRRKYFIPQLISII